MHEETKVGIFVAIGLALFGMAIFLLGDYSFERFYNIDVEFNDVAGLPDKSVIKLSGVEVGKIKKISIKEDKVYVRIAVRHGVKIYRDARFLIGSTSVIGSKFLQIDQGNPSSGVIEPDSTVKGADTLPIDRSLTKAINSIQELVDKLKGEDTNFVDNLNATVDNLRQVTANLNELIADVHPDINRIMKNLDAITEKLDTMLSRTNELVGKIERGQGAVGALVSDEKVKKDVTSTLENLKDASTSVKDVLNRLGGFKMYWNFQVNHEPLARNSKGDFGLRIYPRQGRYYYLGASNLIRTSDIPRGTDYEPANRFDARFGWEFDRLDVYAGLIKGAGGLGFRYRPFKGKGQWRHWRHSPLWDRLVLIFEASDFLRNRYVKDRLFNSPRLEAGVDFALNKYVSAGMRVNDLTETKRFNYTARVIFEDKDISYLFGLITIGSTGTKGRSK
jgi:phospholipid/cholesterol/gamma-HCH transport system substrate-binding protein